MNPRRLTSIAIILLQIFPLPCFPKETIKAKSLNGASDETTTGSDECPLLFGDEHDHEQNEQTRISNLKSTRIVENFISIEHYQNWREPSPIEYKGLELLGTEKTADSEHVATVKVSEELEGLDCEPGIYEVYIDDSIGSDASVLGIFPDILLLLHDNQLRYMKVFGTDSPTWRMIWISKWKIIQLPDPKKKSRYRSNRKRSRSSRRRH